MQGKRKIENTKRKTLIEDNNRKDLIIFMFVNGDMKQK